jgi:hypothetical protein
MLPDASPKRGRIAQSVEQLTLNQRAVGSSPTAPTNTFNDLYGICVALEALWVTSGLQKHSIYLCCLRSYGLRGLSFCPPLKKSLGARRVFRGPW